MWAFGVRVRRECRMSSQGEKEGGPGTQVCRCDIIVEVINQVFD